MASDHQPSVPMEWKKLPEDPAPDFGKPVEFRSPGLKLLSDRLAGPGKHEILDLGSAWGANFEFLNDYSCRVHVADVYPELRNFPPDDPEADPQQLAQSRRRIVDRLLCCEPEVKLDLILAWDLFSYLSPAATTGLMSAVKSRCQSGTLLYLLVSTHSVMPASPGKIVFAGGQRICVEPATARTVECPAYSPISLERMMPGFTMLHSFLLAERMQDYLFSYR